jgi:polysaccharide chain length determinant protein (PEP-CTERM system associated)
MLGHRKLSTKEYADILRRRLVLILACMLALCCISLTASYFIKPMYESQTLILIQRQQVPEEYVKPIVAEDLDARLSSMKEQILSRSRLEPIITRYNLFAGDKVTMDDRVNMMRQAITVTQIQTEQSHAGMPGFFVSFQAHDARTAQSVCGEITSLFVNANLHAQEESAHGTTEFLRQQLADAKMELDQQDAKLAAFQEKYLGRLPDEAAANTNTLQALTSQLDAITQSINQMQQNESFLEATLPQTSSQGGTSSPLADSDEGQDELSALIEQRRKLEAKYTSEYPDLVEVNRKIAALEAAPKQAPVAHVSTAAVSLADSPQVRQNKAQLRALKQSLAAARQEQARVQQRIRADESRIEESPEIEAQYKQITRDHDTALQFYNSLLSKMNESSMAEALQLRQQGEQFMVMDAPNLPDVPKSPKHILFAAGGLFAGLFLGLVLTALLEYRDKALRNADDIWEFTELPTLAVISKVDGPRTEDKKKSSAKTSITGEPLRAKGAGVGHV